MKRYVLSTILLVTFQISALYAQPKLTIVGGTSFEFGDVYTDIPVKKIITLKNEGTDTLIISNVSSSCGCTAALMSNSHIPPGDSGLLSISFDGKKFSGIIRRTVSFESNDPQQQKNRISFSANVLKLLSIEPEYIMFNRVFLDSSSTQSLLIKNNSNETIKVVGIHPTTDIVTTKIEKKTLKPNDSTYIECTIKPTSTGSINGNINIETDHPKVQTVSVRFFGYGTKPAFSKTDTH